MMAKTLIIAVVTAIVVAGTGLINTADAGPRSCRSRGVVTHRHQVRAIFHRPVQQHVQQPQGGPTQVEQPQETINRKTAANKKSVRSSDQPSPKLFAYKLVTVDADKDIKKWVPVLPNVVNEDDGEIYTVTSTPMEQPEVTGLSLISIEP